MSKRRKDLKEVKSSNKICIYQNFYISLHYRNKDGETLDCFIDRVTIKDAGFVECVFSGVQDYDFESTESVRFLDIYTIMSVMEWVAEYFDVMDEIASKDNVK